MCEPNLIAWVFETVLKFQCEVGFGTFARSVLLLKEPVVVHVTCEVLGICILLAFNIIGHVLYLFASALPAFLDGEWVSVLRETRVFSLEFFQAKNDRFHANLIKGVCLC